jgi:uncharacterized membrane protein
VLSLAVVNKTFHHNYIPRYVVALSAKLLVIMPPIVVEILIIHTALALFWVVVRGTHRVATIAQFVVGNQMILLVITQRVAVDLAMLMVVIHTFSSVAVTTILVVPLRPQSVEVKTM